MARILQRHSQLVGRIPIEGLDDHSRCVQHRTTIESKPPDPNKNSAKEHEVNIMRLRMALLTLVLSLSEDKRIG
jgi:hypothetical protein